MLYSKTFLSHCLLLVMGVILPMATVQAQGQSAQNREETRQSEVAPSPQPVHARRRVDAPVTLPAFGAGRQQATLLSAPPLQRLLQQAPATKPASKSKNPLALTFLWLGIFLILVPIGFLILGLLIMDSVAASIFFLLAACFAACGVLGIFYVVKGISLLSKQSQQPDAVPPPPPDYYR